MKTKKIIAVIGMPGSGKSETIKYLEKKYSWPKIYFGQATFIRMKKDGLTLTQKNERLIREKIRRELGMGAYAKLALPEISQALKQSNIVLIESLYSWEEYKIIKNKFNGQFKVIAIYASPATRFSRLKKRKNRSLKTQKEFNERDWSEIENIDKGGPIAMADFTFINEATTEELYKNIDETVKKII